MCLRRFGFKDLALSPFALCVNWVPPVTVGCAPTTRPSATFVDSPPPNTIGLRCFVKLLEPPKSNSCVESRDSARWSGYKRREVRHCWHCCQPSPLQATASICATSLRCDQGAYVRVACLEKDSFLPIYSPIARMAFSVLIFWESWQKQHLYNRNSYWTLYKRLILNIWVLIDAQSQPK